MEIGKRDCLEGVLVDRRKLAGRGRRAHSRRPNHGRGGGRAAPQRVHPHPHGLLFARASAFRSLGPSNIQQRNNTSSSSCLPFLLSNNNNQHGCLAHHLITPFPLHPHTPLTTTTHTRRRLALTFLHLHAGTLSLIIISSSWSALPFFALLCRGRSQPLHASPSRCCAAHPAPSCMFFCFPHSLLAHGLHHPSSAPPPIPGPDLFSSLMLVAPHACYYRPL